MSISLSGSLLLTGSIVASGTITMSGSIASASFATNSSLLQGTGSTGFTTTGSFTATSSSLSSRTTQIESVYATTGSNSFRATQSITGSLTVTGQIIAQTLNVQQVTSSIVFSSGSNNFGNQLSNNQTFTGSVNITGSLALAGNITSNNTAVVLGSGTTNFLLKFTGASTTGNSILSESGYTLTQTSSNALSVYVIKGTGSTTGLWLYTNGANATLSNQDNGSLAFQTNGTDRLTIACTGVTTFSSCITATQGIFSLNTVGGATGSVRNLTLLNTNEAIGNWSGINFSYSNSGTNFAYIGTVVTSDVGNSKADLVFGAKASTSATVVTEYMRIQAGGNVGVATNSPAAKISISCLMGAALPYLDSTSNSFDFNGYYVGESNNGNTGTVGGLILQNNLYCVGSYSPVIAFMSRASSGAYSNSYAAIFGQVSGVGGDSNWTAGGLVFQTSNAYGPVERMRLHANGDFTVGSCSTASTKNMYWSEGAGEFQLNGGAGSNSVGATGATLRIGNNTTSARRFWSLQLDGSNQFGTWYYAEGVGWSKLGYQTTGGTWTNSDERRKENIVSSNYGLNEVLQLTPKKFNFKIDERKIQNLGFIAQEVLPIIPEAVQSDEDDGKQYYAMNYANLVPVLVKAIQEQQCTINTLKTCIGIA